MLTVFPCDVLICRDNQLVGEFNASGLVFKDCTYLRPEQLCLVVLLAYTVMIVDETLRTGCCIVVEHIGNDV